MKKDMTIYRLPYVLVLHLKRFSKRGKIKSKVNLPLKLEMMPYLAQENNFGEVGNTFELFAISHHSGGYNGGHYTAEVKRGSSWYECDDSIISRLDKP